MADWKSIVGAVAPALATVLGGPLAGVAVKALSTKLLGREDGTEADIAAAVATMGPADLLRLKEVEADLAKAFAAAEIEMEKVAAQDRDSARRRAVEMRDYTPNVLAVAIIVIYSYVLYLLLQGAELGADANVVFMMLGSLTSALTQVLNYFFGSTKGSNDKTRIMAAASNAKGAA